MTKKKKYKYETTSIKIGTTYVEDVRENKKKTGVNIQDFIEDAIVYKLSQKPVKQK